MISMVKKSWDGLYEWLVFILLAAPIFAIYLPSKFRSVLLFVALILAYRERHLIRVDRGLVQIAVLMLAYLLLFTLVSTEWERSVKGAYDMIRGTLMFFVAYLLALKLDDPRKFLLLTVTATALILASFAFPQRAGAFYGYHLNPNNVAVTLTVYVILALPLLTRHAWRYLGWAISFGGVAAGCYLLMLANSRGAWLGLSGAGVMIALMLPHIKIRQRIGVTAVLMASLAGILLFANTKGFALNAREQIWMGLLTETLENRPLMGFGLNCIKDVMASMGLPTLTAHNFFLEVFVSSGFIGLCFVLFIMYRLLRDLVGYEYRYGTVFYMGVAGLTAYLLMAQFDLKMSSFRFMATISLFLGFIYSQRVRPQAD